MLAEKHRPRSFDEVIGRGTVIGAIPIALALSVLRRDGPSESDR